MHAMRAVMNAGLAPNVLTGCVRRLGKIPGAESHCRSLDSQWGMRPQEPKRVQGGCCESWSNPRSRSLLEGGGMRACVPRWG